MVDTHQHPRHGCFWGRSTRPVVLLAALGVATLVSGSTSDDIERQAVTSTQSPRHESKNTATVSGRTFGDVTPAGTHDQRLSALNDVRQLAAAVSGSTEEQSSATGGTLFSMKKIRTYEGQRLDASSMRQEVLAAPEEEQMCERWAVLTSIFEPTEAVRQLASPTNDWCVVVVGDKSGKSFFLSKTALTYTVTLTSPVKLHSSFSRHKQQQYTAPMQSL